MRWAVRLCRVEREFARAALVGPSGADWAGVGKNGPVRGAGLRLWGFWAGLALGFGLLFYFFFSSISNSNQLFEFKQNFEFHNLKHTSKIQAPA